MTIETRKHLSVAAVLASVVCAIFLVASAFAAAAASGNAVQAVEVQASEWRDAPVSVAPTKIK